MIESALTNLWILLGFLLDGFWSDTHYFGKFVELELKHIFFFSLCEVAKVLRCSLELSCSFTDKCHTYSINFSELILGTIMVLYKQYKIKKIYNLETIQNLFFISKFLLFVFKLILISRNCQKS